MPQQVQIVLNPEAAAHINTVRNTAARAAKTDPSAISEIRIIKRSVDARQKNIRNTYN